MKQFNRSHLRYKTLLLFLILFFIPSIVLASYSFEWSPNHPNDLVVEYRIYWSTTSGAYNQTDMEEIAVTALSDPDNPEWTLTELILPDPVPVYYFVITAVDQDGVESDRSIELDTAAPQVTSAPTVVSFTDTSATITWVTDKPGNSVVEYSTNSDLVRLDRHTIDCDLCNQPQCYHK